MDEYRTNYRITPSNKKNNNEVVHKNTTIYSSYNDN